MPDPNEDVRVSVAQVVARLGVSVDTGDYPAARACFADEVMTDYTSLTGGEPAKIAADDLIVGWEQALSALDAVHHLLGPAVVKAESATAASLWCAGQVSHVFGGERWTIGGHYRYSLEHDGSHWRIAAAAFDLQWEEGSRELMSKAAAAKGSS